MKLMSIHCWDGERFDLILSGTPFVRLSERKKDGELLIDG